MDILSQYRQQHLEAFREKPQWQPPSEYGFFIRLVMRLSGGRVRDARQASVVLLIVAGVIVVASLILFFAGSGSNVPPSPPTPLQMESR